VNLILCGLPMSGKTTIGNKLAEQLERPFIDSDRLIEAVYAARKGKKLSCRLIFSQEGEFFFRELEKQQIRSLVSVTKSVIAVGGGTLIDKENTRILKMIGSLIYLKNNSSVLWKRVELRDMPTYLESDNPEKAFLAIAKLRIPIYEAAANITIDAEHSNEDEVVKKIIGATIHGK